MNELIFEDVSLEINKTKIASNIFFHAKGLCCIHTEIDSSNYKELLLFFSKTHLYSSNDIKVDGHVYFNGKILPATKFHHLLNQHIVFEGNESVFDVISLIDKKEAEKIIRGLGIYFPNKKTSHLSVQESRLFEVAVNIAAKPPVMFLKTFGMTHKQKEKCLIILSEFVKHNESVIFIESEYASLFDCALIIKNKEILSLDKNEAAKFFRSKELIAFELQTKPQEMINGASDVIKHNNTINISDNISTINISDNINKTNQPYNYKSLFNKYKTSNLIDLKHKNMSFYNRLTTLDFYKLNLGQAMVLGYNKYEMTFQKQEKRLGVMKSLFPCFFLIFILRLIDGITDKTNIHHIPDLIALACDAFLNRNYVPALILFFLETFILNDLSSNTLKIFLKKIFREKFSELGLRLIFASVCFSIMYHYSSIFEEDFQALNYNINVLMTPGTYIASIFIFTILAHATTFCFIGWIFNIRLMALNLVCAFFINLICFGFLGKKLRTTFIGFYISTCLFSIILDTNNTFSYIILHLFYAIFPINVYSSELGNGNYSYMTFSLIYLLIYCSSIYVMTCYRLSFY